ncbi:2003_t:CDS:1, partial [Paraglomus brasilianum]
CRTDGHVTVTDSGFLGVVCAVTQIIDDLNRCYQRDPDAVRA